MKRICLCLLGTLLNWSTAWSLDGDLTLQRLNHRAFTIAEGAPAQVFALAQTRDGTLWAGGETGLTRFDGLHFVQYPGPADPPLPSSNVSALLASADGGLWIGFRLGGVSFLRDGHLTQYGDREGMPRGTVYRLTWDRDGALLAATPNGLARIHGGRAEKVAGDVITAAVGVWVDRAGTLWVATRDNVLARAAGTPDFRVVAQLKHGMDDAGSVFAESPDGGVWVANDDNALYRLDPPTVAQPRTRSFRLPYAESALYFDSEGNVWLPGDLRSYFWPSRRLIADAQSSEGIAHIEEIHDAEDMPGGPYIIFEDREHNIWFGTSKGLDRFSRTNVVHALPPCAGMGYALAAGDAGAVWAACGPSESTKGSLLEIRNGRIVGQRETADYTAAYRDPSGTVWFGGPTELAHLQDGKLVTTPMPEQVRGFQVLALARDPSGALWVSQKDLNRVLDGQWSPYGGLDALPHTSPIVETVDDAGAIWFGYTRNRIALLRGRTVLTFDPAQGVNVGTVLAIHVTGRQVWVGGDVGFARFDGTRFVPILSASGRPFKGISGIADTKDGALWLNTINGIVRIPPPEVERLTRDPGYRVRYETFDYLDGVPGVPPQLRPIPSAMAAADGRVWFALSGGLAWIDALHLTRNTLAPPVSIWSIDSGGKEYRNLGTPLHLPILTTRVQVNYSAGSLTVPERVRFRYKLEGSDREWQDGGNLREALYTNLGPGRYTFRVIASNNDGVWNNTGAAVDFTISPAVYQTKWFYALCALLCLAVIIALYRLRMRQVAAQIRGRFQERLAERERIARELHDTLLQGVQGLIWRFQAATNRIPRDEKAREQLEESIERAERLLTESRDRVKDLRDSRDATDLAQVLATEGEQLALVTPTQFEMSVEGVAQELHPIVREEAYLIAREALTNAFRHSGAQHIEAEVSYGEASLEVRVRDDGCGMSPDVLQTGQRTNHFGLVGMRERAQRIHAELVVWSKPGGGTGTEVELRVPAHIAYRSRKVPRWLWWRRKFTVPPDYRHSTRA